MKSKKIGVISGGTFANDMVMDNLMGLVISSHNKSTSKIINKCICNKHIKTMITSDVRGVELCGALKNIIALAAGISDGVGYGDNTKAALITRGIVEIARLGVAMGAKKETFGGLSGIGDLIVTCTSMHSRNRRAGILLGQGKSLEETLEEIHMVVEGVVNAKAAYELSEKYNVSMPITKQINEVLYNKKDVKQAVYDLMTRGKTKETEKDMYKL